MPSPIKRHQHRAIFCAGDRRRARDHLEDPTCHPTASRRCGYELCIIYLLDYGAACDRQRLRLHSSCQRLLVLDSRGSVRYPR